MSSLKLFRWLFSVASFYFSFIHLYIFVFVVHWTTTSTTATKTKTFKNNNKTEQNEVEKHHALYLSVPLTGNESTRCFARTLLSNSFALISFHFMVLLYCISVWFFFSFHPPSRRSFTHHSFTLNSHNISWNFILAFCVSLSLPVSIAFFSRITFYSPVLLLVIRYYFYFLCCCFCVCENQFTRFAWFPFGWNGFFCVEHMVEICHFQCRKHFGSFHVQRGINHYIIVIVIAIVEGNFMRHTTINHSKCAI